MSKLNLHQKILFIALVLLVVKSIIELTSGLYLDLVIKPSIDIHHDNFYLIKKFYSPILILIIASTILIRIKKNSFYRTSFTLIVILIFAGLSKFFTVDGFNFYIISSLVFYLIFGFFIIASKNKLFSNK